MVEKVIDKKWHVTTDKSSSQKVLLKTSAYKAMKKLADILLAFVGLVVSIPIIVIAVILIKSETEGPIIYTQKRVGKNGRIFQIYKLRTMYFNAEKDGIQWAQKDDPRVTKVGRFLRKSRIDEFPQFINVLKGDMSIVGPRPERPYFVEEFGRVLPQFYERLAVLPGITGWSQINGGYELTPEQKLEKDLFYIQNQSVLLDFKIIMRTIRIILTSEGAR